jgi:glycosyltransferase involved in cell wall biosynthesis
MNILFVNTRYVPEGAGDPACTIQHVAESLVARGDRATVVCRTTEKGISRELLNGVAVVRLGLDLSPGRAIAVLVGVIEKERPEILHLHLHSQLPAHALLPLAREHGIAVVQTLHDTRMLLCPVGDLARGKNCQTQCTDCRARTAVARAFVREVDGIIATSCHIRDMHTRMGVAIPLGVTRVIYKAHEQAPSLPKKPRTGPLRLGLHGVPTQSDGFSSLLDVLTNRLAHESWSLAIRGLDDSGFLNPLLSTCPDASVRFLGPIEPAQFFAELDVLVLPSAQEETAGHPWIESFAHGVPVLAARRGSNPEGVGDGHTGILFDADRPGHIVSSLRRLIDEHALAVAMGRAAREKWKRELTPACSLARHEEVYRTALKNRRNRIHRVVVDGGSTPTTGAPAATSPDTWPRVLRRDALPTSSIWGVTTFFNPASYGSFLHNYKIFRHFLPIPLLAVELSFSGSYELGPGDAEILVRVDDGDILWHKERLMNLGAQHLPPECCKVVFLDCDLIFADDRWVQKLDAAMDRYTVVQPFQHEFTLPPYTYPRPDAQRAGKPTDSFAFNRRRGISSFGAVGRVWAIRRELTARHGLYDREVLGSGDLFLALAITGEWQKARQLLTLGEAQYHDYEQWGRAIAMDVGGDIGFVDVPLFALWHGALPDRKYLKRHEQMLEFGFDPTTDIALTRQGCWRWASDKPRMQEYVRGYFSSRKDDGSYVRLADGRFAMLV